MSPKISTTSSWWPFADGEKCLDGSNFEQVGRCVLGPGSVGGVGRNGKRISSTQTMYHLNSIETLGVTWHSMSPVRTIVEHTTCVHCLWWHPTFLCVTKFGQIDIFLFVNSFTYAESIWTPSWTFLFYFTLTKCDWFRTTNIIYIYIDTTTNGHTRTWQKLNQKLTHSNSAFCPPEETNFCSIRWYGCFLSSNSIGDVNPTEHTRNVNLLNQQSVSIKQRSSLEVINNTNEKILNALVFSLFHAKTKYWKPSGPIYIAQIFKDLKVIHLRSIKNKI